MKTSELVKGESYGTVWGCEMEYVGTKEYNGYNEYTGEPTHSVRYVFNDEGGKSYLSEDEVERFVSNGMVEISTHRLGEIMQGMQALDDRILEALGIVTKLTDAIEDMKYDCDGEVYDALLKVAEVLGR